jgi:hypothetical protein
MKMQIFNKIAAEAYEKDEEAFNKELDHASCIIENLVYDFPHRKAQLLACLREYIRLIEDGEWTSD